MSVPSNDPTKPPSAYRRALTRIALSRPGTWFYMNLASRIDAPLAKATRGRLTTTLGSFPVLVLTAKGAKSGVDRTVPLLYFTEGDDVIVMASSFGRPRYPAWYRNLKANPTCQAWAGGRGGTYVARETEGPERDRLYALAKALYSGYGVYEQRVEGKRTVPVMRLTPA